ncbi:hypothetical protein TNCV_2664321 [Trichonephila clavipes]|nr:hypothetical protein TNCV_2664321 [Trichonephila clavipes]
MRGRIIGKIEEGRKITDVAREFPDIAHSVVSRLWKSFLKLLECTSGRRHERGRVRSTADAHAEDRIYRPIIAKRNKAHHSSSRWQISFLLPRGKQISRKKLLPDV